MYGSTQETHSTKIHSFLVGVWTNDPHGSCGPIQESRQQSPAWGVLPGREGVGMYQAV